LHFSAASRLAGIVAILLQVPNAVNAGVIFVQNIFKPNLPPVKRTN
jgi:hypothetical protein